MLTDLDSTASSSCEVGGGSGSRAERSPPAICSVTAVALRTGPAIDVATRNARTTANSNAMAEANRNHPAAPPSSGRSAPVTATITVERATVRPVAAYRTPRRPTPLTVPPCISTCSSDAEIVTPAG